MRSPFVRRELLDPENLEEETKALEGGNGFGSLIGDSPSGKRHDSRSSDLSARLQEPSYFLGTSLADGDRGSEDDDVFRLEEAAVTLGLGATVGYVLWNVRNLSWLVSLALSSPLWKQYDVLDVVQAWEEKKTGVGLDDDEDEEPVQRVLD
jgi:hypothetical protein